MKKTGNLFKLLLSIGVFAAITVIFIQGAGSARGEYKQEKLTAVQNAVKRAAVSCYAIEGVYPPDIAYMKEHYGLAVDETKYTLIYLVYASNMMPEIEVLPLGDEAYEQSVTKTSVQ